MATVYKTPGVYIEEISKFPPSIAQVETAIPAFIGYTETATRDGEDLTNVPTRILSLLEYQTYFGGAQEEENLVVTIDDTTDGATPPNVLTETINVAFSPTPIADPPSQHTMFYAMQAYFSNGGGPCYIVSVGPFLPNLGDAIQAGDPTDPLTPGLATGLIAIRNEDEPTLLVFPEGQTLAGADPGGYFLLQNAALQQCEDLKDRFCIMDLQHTGVGLDNSTVGAEATTFRNGITSPNVKYGAAYFPNLRTVFNYARDESAITITHNRDGVAASGPQEGADVASLETTEGALFSRIQLALDNLPITLPPSSTMAGIYARVDSTRGVFKAPANEGVIGATGLTFKVIDEIQDGLNVDTTAGKSINAIRAFTGKGILVWGARTLAGNDNEWRYISVRRFFNMVEESVKKGTSRFVFEPNDANTWVKVRAMIENFLLLQWRAGALAGAKPEDGFFVRVGLGETMTSLDILEGRMIVEIGMAAVRPAEFIILRFSHLMQVS